MSGWIGIDLDGTLADHYWPDKGPYDPLRIGAPIGPMVERVQAMLAQGLEVRIFTARVSPPDVQQARADGVPADVIRQHVEEIPAIHAAIEAWALEHVGRALKATATKDYGCVAIYDDRAVHIIHNTGLPCCDALKGA